MATASLGQFFADNTVGNPAYDVSPYDYNKFVSQYGRGPSGQQEWQDWQANSWLRDHNMTPQQFLSSYGPSAANGATVDASGNVNYKNYGDSVGEFFGVPALFAGLAAGSGAINGAFGGGGALGGSANFYDPSVASTFNSGLTSGAAGAAGGNMDLSNFLGDLPLDTGAGLPPLASDLGAAAGGGDYNSFLQSIGIDPASTQFSGGTLSNADIMSSIGGGGSSGLSGLLQQLQQSTGLSGSSLAQLVGRLGAAGLGALGSASQASALKGLASQYSNMGAPYRAMLAQSYADPNAFLKNSPDIQASVNQGTDALARALSTQGNPAGSGNALQQLQSYATNSLYGKLGSARDQLAGFGGLSSYTGASPGLQTQAIGAQGNIFNAIGSGLSSATNPPTTLEQALNALNANNFKLGAQV